MGKWIRETDCEGKKVTYKCDACGFPDGWHDYKLCPMCGDPKEIESEDDDGIEWPEDTKMLCIHFDCFYSDGTGLCTNPNVNPYEPTISGCYVKEDPYEK